MSREMAERLRDLARDLAAELRDPERLARITGRAEADERESAA
jgi:hypothetical protein